MTSQSAVQSAAVVLVVSAREGFLSSVAAAVAPLGAVARAAAPHAVPGPDALAVVVDHAPPALDVLAGLAAWRAQDGDPPRPVLLVVPASDTATLPQATRSGVELGVVDVGEPGLLAEALRALLQLGRLTASLRAEREHARLRQEEFRAAQRRKDEVTAHVVHDLKNRLASILPNAQFLLMETGLSEEGRGAANDIVAAAESMHRMAVNLVDISRAETGGLHTVLAPLDLGMLVQDVRTKQAKRALEKQQKLDASDVAAGVQVRGDRALLRRLLENLLDNAMHYAPAGSAIRLVLRPPAADGMVELCVVDEGHAMAEPLREKAFDRDAQLDLGTEPSTRISAGLGLVFCRLVADVHKGRISMVDHPPKGNAFVVRLPVDKPL